ncbi:hypothetical protein HMY34_02910 [Thiothrix subterranea]|uniref:hypothetical protein n=1 Tax=Thiothrix subterranea TaxID=2735563 RepID=UPI00192B1578|nr:hypothetical protein [Thiothrix subterranea]QQZ27785.1 hypothetical protein HMY34_02910 [Thiothrix subterranea]
MRNIQQTQQSFLFWVQNASLIVLCERLNTCFVASVDSDFTVYRDYATNLFWE